MNEFSINLRREMRVTLTQNPDRINRIESGHGLGHGQWAWSKMGRT